MTQTSSDNSQQQQGNSELTLNELAGMEKKFLRLTFWQTVLSVAGVFTGAVALYVALTESQAVRQQTSAAVWPYVQLMMNDTSDGDSAFFSLSLSNVGVGPARMQGARLTLDGVAVREWQAITEKLLPEGATLGVDYGKSSAARRVLAPGETLVAFNTENTELALKLQESVYNGALAVSYCYCSIFDECWNMPSSIADTEEPIQPVANCPDYGEEGFLD